MKMERMVEGAVVGEQSKVIRRMSWQVQEETLPDRSRSAGSLKIQEKCFYFRLDHFKVIYKVEQAGCMQMSLACDITGVTAHDILFTKNNS